MYNLYALSFESAAYDVSGCPKSGLLFTLAKSYFACLSGLTPSPDLT